MHTVQASPLSTWLCHCIWVPTYTGPCHFNSRGTHSLFRWKPSFPRWKVSVLIKPASWLINHQIHLIAERLYIQHFLLLWTKGRNHYTQILFHYTQKSPCKAQNVHKELPDVSYMEPWIPSKKPELSELDNRRKTRLNGQTRVNPNT